MVAGTAAIQTQWDGVMVEAVRSAIAENAGKRILVLGSYRNRYMFVRKLSGANGARLVDMRSWLETNGFGRSGSASR
jgi:hypothetical protein